MNRLVCFLIVGLAVIALQATTVEAQGGDPNMAPPTAAAPGGPPTAAAPGGPPTAAAPGGPPMGDSAAKPSLGERVKSFFGMDTKDATPPTGAPVLTIGDPACATVPPAAGCPAGSPGMMGDPNMPPPTGAAGK